MARLILVLLPCLLSSSSAFPDVFTEFSVNCSETSGWDYYGERAAQADDVDSLLLAVAANVPPDSRSAGASDWHTPLPALQKALERYPDNEIVLITAIAECNKASNEVHPLCDADFEQQLTQLDPENGFYWLQRAAKSYERVDRVAALSFMLRVSQASKYDRLFAERIISFDRAIRLHTSDDNLCSVIDAIGIAAAIYFPYLATHARMCIENANDSEWRSACLHASKLMEAESDTLIDVSVGLKLQAEQYEATGDLEQASDAMARRQALWALMTEAGEPGLGHCIIESRDNANACLSNWLALGEHKALQRALQEGSFCSPLPR